jgi:hypothetical protein
LLPLEILEGGHILRNEEHRKEEVEKWVVGSIYKE